MGKVNIVGKMVHHMTVVLFKEKDKELVDGNLVKKIMMYILEVIRMIRNLGKGNMCGIMGLCMKDILLMILSNVCVYCRHGEGRVEYPDGREIRGFW